jgi:hypothetical protein
MTTKRNLQTFTKTMAPAEWFEFQKQPAVVDVLEVETTENSIPGYKEQRYTFTWDASKAKHQ